MKLILLTQGYEAIVDDEDYEYLMQWKWHTAGRMKYAARKDPVTHKMVWMHRVIMKTPGTLQVDHINGNPRDNRRDNLRNCTQQQNSRNTKKLANTSSKYKGVSWFEECQKWKTIITNSEGKTIHIGLFSEERHAGLAYDLWAKDMFGEYARTNF